MPACADRRPHLEVKVVGEQHEDLRGADVDVGVCQVRADLHRISLAPEVCINDRVGWQRLPGFNLTTTIVVKSQAIFNLTYKKYIKQDTISHLRVLIYAFPSCFLPKTEEETAGDTVHLQDMKLLITCRPCKLVGDNDKPPKKLDKLDFGCSKGGRKINNTSVARSGMATYIHLIVAQKPLGVGFHGHQQAVVSQPPPLCWCRPCLHHLQRKIHVIF